MGQSCASCTKQDANDCRIKCKYQQQKGILKEI